MNLEALIEARDELIREFGKTIGAIDNTTFEKAEEKLKKFCTEKFYELETEEDMDILNYFEITMRAIIKCAYDKDYTDDVRAMDDIVKKYKEVH